MEKINEYNNDVHATWVTDQLTDGVPLWSTSVSAYARVLANNAHMFDVELLHQAKVHIDKYGYDALDAAGMPDIQ